MEQDDSQDEAELEQWNEPGENNDGNDDDDDDDDDDDGDAVNDDDDGGQSDGNKRTFSGSKAKAKVNGHDLKAKGKKVTASRIELSDSSRSGDGLSEPPESEQSE